MELLLPFYDMENLKISVIKNFVQKAIRFKETVPSIQMYLLKIGYWGKSKIFLLHICKLGFLIIMTWIQLFFIFLKILEWIVIKCKLSDESSGAQVELFNVIHECKVIHHSSWRAPDYPGLSVQNICQIVLFIY